MFTTLRRFLGDVRGGATAIAAAAVTLMTLGGAALMSDHLWLVDQRDTLKTAADAAGVAATLELNRQLGHDPAVNDADLKTALQAVAKRYVILNLQHLPRERLAKAMDTLVVDVLPHRASRRVDVSAQADLGGFLFAGRMPLLGGIAGPEGGMRAVAVSETVTAPVEVVLAIDISDSMNANLAGKHQTRDESRMDIVKRAAKSLVGILNPNAHDRVAIGIVPWNQAVRLESGAAGKWASERWARYPTRRVYGVPYKCAPAGSCTLPPGVEENLPSASAGDAWMGCLDGHRMGATTSTRASVPSSDEFLSLPSANPFAQGYFVPTYGVAYSCLEAPLPTDYLGQICYHGTPPSPGPSKVASQYVCGVDFPTILPLSTERTSIDQTIDALTSRVTGYTYSALGVLWGQRLLDHTWNDVWGGSAHPVDPGLPDNASLRKAIVLLTDGEDTHCGQGNYDCRGSSIGTARSDACDEAKDEGTEIFVVAAMHKDKVADDFKTSLTACSSAADNPDGTYVFLENSTKEELNAAFSDIANQLRTVRRVY